MNEVVFCDYLRRKNSDLSFLQSEARLWCLASPEMASGRDFDKQRTQGHDFVYTYNKKVRSIELRTEKHIALIKCCQTLLYPFYRIFKSSKTLPNTKSKPVFLSKHTLSIKIAIILNLCCKTILTYNEKKIKRQIGKI